MLIPRKNWGRSGERGGIIFRLIGLLVLAAMVFGLYLLRRPILREAADYWVVEDTPSAADALIILSDDNLEGSRARRAAELYFDHRAPVIVASGRMLRPYAGIGELMQRDLTDRGVPATAVVIFRQSAADTIDEAQSLKSLVVQKGWRHVVLVTSNYHTRRARYIFRKLFPSSVQVDVASAKDPEFDPDDWWQHKAGLKIFAHEVVGMCEAMWELRHEPAGDGKQAERGEKGREREEAARRADTLRSSRRPVKWHFRFEISDFRGEGD
jgi:uncharacterized SAM-binding protein YcdF (DUF218 family)